MKKAFVYHLLFRTLRAQALVELLVAIGLAAILIPALFTGIYASRQGKPQESQRIAAIALSREAGEAVRSVREKGWSTFALNGTYHPEISSGSWSLVSGAENINGYTRQIVISDTQRDSSGQIVDSGGTVDSSTKKVTTTISWTTPFNSSVQTTSYYERYLGNTAFTHTSQSDFNGGSNSSTTVVSSGGGAVELTQSTGSPTDYGNKFRVESTSSMGNMTSSGHKSSLKFTAQATKTVNAVRVYLDAENGNSPSYRYGLQNNVAGVPSGVFFASGTLTATSSGWKTVNLTSPTTITAGNTYHLVVEPVGSPSGGSNIALRRTSPQNNLYPFNNTADPNANTLFKAGSSSSWLVQGFQPMYELDFSDSTYEGNPYETGTQTSVFGVNFIGEKIRPASTITANSVSFYARQNNAAEPADSLRVEVRNADDNSVLENGILATAAAATTSYQYFTYTFPTPRTLPINVNGYRIVLRSSGSNPSNNYQVYRVETTNAANYNSITYDGTNSLYTVSSNSGSTWTDTNVNWDIGGFYLTIQGTLAYAGSGDFTSHASSSFDTGANVSFNNLVFNFSAPANTTLRLQVAINTDNSTWNYFGPDGTGGTFYTVSGPISLAKISGRYLRYKAFFTSNGSATPTLNDVSINYSP